MDIHDLIAQSEEENIGAVAAPENTRCECTECRELSPTLRAGADYRVTSAERDVLISRLCIHHEVPVVYYFE